MRTFSAIVFDANGAEKLIDVKANTEAEVQQYLREQGLTYKKIEEKIQQSLWQMLNETEIGQRIKPQNRIRVLKTLGQMINRGYVLESVLDFLLADEKQKDVIKLLQILQKKAKKGYKDYVELFKSAEDYFDREFFSIIYAGQKTGTVGQNIIDYADGKAKALAQKGKLMGVLMSKFIIFAVVFVSFIVTVTFIVPQFQKLFKGDVQLPLGMQVMVVLSQIAQQYGVFILTVCLGSIITLVVLYKVNTSIRFFFQDMMIKTPVLGGLIRMINTRDFLYMMGNLMSKGVSLMEAVRITIEQSGNLCFKKVYEAIEANLEKGRKLEQVLKPIDPQLINAGLYQEVPQGYLLDSVAQAMTLGSKGGNLGEMLNEAYQTYDFQLQNRIDSTIKVIGGLITVFNYSLIIFMISSLATTLFKVMENPQALAFVDFTTHFLS